MKLLTGILSLLILISCNGQAQQQNFKGKADNEKTVAYIEKANLDQYNVAYFASGCFWCVEAIYENVIGVKESISGYAGGHSDFVNYPLSNTGRTGHAEAVAIYYDANEIDFATLVDVFFGSQNITQKNGQGPDRGSQYRSILFYSTDEEKQIIDSKVSAVEAEIGEEVGAEVQEFDRFFVAEDYHQDYKKHNPRQPYILSVSDPRYKRFAKKFPQLIKEDKR